MASITVENGELIYQSPFDHRLVARLKAEIPSTERKWDKSRKVWRVAARHARLLHDLTLRYLDENIPIPTVQTASLTTIKTLKVYYIGATKDRPGAAERSAFGFCDGNWNVIFPEKVLMAWFGAPTDQSVADNFYACLGISKIDDQEKIKKAFRRTAKQWHPDVCKEPDAEDVFKRINKAYQVLSDPNKKARYDAGLVLTASLTRAQKAAPYNALIMGYRSPLRCGWILAEGIETLGRFVVSKILGWEDIVENGKTLVTSWSIDSDMFVEYWS